jgi:hypothetical protein
METKEKISGGREGRNERGGEKQVTREKQG